MYSFDAVNGWYPIADFSTEFGEGYAGIAAGFSPAVVMSRYGDGANSFHVYERLPPTPKHPYQFFVKVSLGLRDYDIVTKDFPSLVELLNKIQVMGTLNST